MKVLKVVLSVALLLVMSAVSSAQDPAMTGTDKAKKSQKHSGTTGLQIFSLNCNRCHPNGDNVILPDLPLRGSSKLANFNTFLSFIRDPKMPDGSEGVMPVFSNKHISDQEAKRLYQYITSSGTSGMMGSGNMGYGMMGGGMMGRGNMGHGMMGGGMMGGYYHSEECQKFLDDTAGLRKELYNKRFEYSEAYRNPKTTPEAIVKLEREIYELQKQIYAKTPMGCGW